MKTKGVKTKGSKTTLPDGKKGGKEPPVVQDQGFFTHETGDTYDGFFEARKKEKILKMNGPGTYTTAEGDVYTGVWESDRIVLVEPATISYHDGSRYEGYVKDWTYFDIGKYYHPDGSLITCAFVDNSPVGSMVLKDPNGQTWLAKAEQGYAWFEPINHYYDMLEKKVPRADRIKRRHQQSAESLGQNPASKK